MPIIKKFIIFSPEYSLLYTSKKKKNQAILTLWVSFFHIFGFLTCFYPFTKTWPNQLMFRSQLLPAFYKKSMGSCGLQLQLTFLNSITMFLDIS
jgi:hypothetical protein